MVISTYLKSRIVSLKTREISELSVDRILPVPSLLSLVSAKLVYKVAYGLMSPLFGFF